MSREIFLVRARTDLGSLSVRDLPPHLVVGRSEHLQRVVPNVDNDTPQVNALGLQRTTRAAYNGLAAYLMDNVEAGGLGVGVAALTPAQAVAAAADILDEIQIGQDGAGEPPLYISVDLINNFLSDQVAQTELAPTTSASRGSLHEVLRILAGDRYTLPASSIVQDAGGALAATRLGSFDGRYRPIFDGDIFRRSLHEGDLSVYASNQFTFLGIAGAAIAVFDSSGRRVGGHQQDDAQHIESGMVAESGMMPGGTFFLDGVVGDGETVTINGVVFEFDTNAAIAGDVLVDVNADQTADAAVTALRQAIENTDLADFPGLGSLLAQEDANNADGSSILRIFSERVGGTFGLTTTCVNGGITTTDGDYPRTKSTATIRRTIDAGDAAILAAAAANTLVLGYLPAADRWDVEAVVIRTAAGALRTPDTQAFEVEQVSDGQWAVTTTGNAAGIVATDTLIVTVTSQPYKNPGSGNF